MFVYFSEANLLATILALILFAGGAVRDDGLLALSAADIPVRRCVMSLPASMKHSVFHGHHHLFLGGHRLFWVIFLFFGRLHFHLIGIL